MNYSILLPTLIGRMDLHWPPCVPYKYSSDVRLGSHVQRGSSSEKNSTVVSSSKRDTVPPSPVYANTPLRNDHFRLLCLVPADGDNYPICGTIERHGYDNCPDYETVSYTWGGEEGDFNPVHPLYVGPHWDVLLQTRNCWSMLQYLRPQRGIRLIWVDAICIDQKNMLERESQVAKMVLIYTNCLNVIE